LAFANNDVIKKYLRVPVVLVLSSAIGKSNQLSATN
jgi:hypothetical protein